MSRRGRPRFKTYWFVYLLILPAVGYRLFWSVWPLIDTVRLSLTDSNFIYGTESFIGLENFRTLVSDPDFRNSVLISVSYTVIIVIGTVILGLCVAQLLAKRVRGRVLGRIAILLPFTIPTVLAGQMWRSLATNTGSPINDILLRLGVIDERIPWLSNAWSARLIVILASLWRFTPFAAILFVAALGSVPKELHEAAQIDGANGWRRFQHITVPVISPTVLVVMMFQAIEALRAFDIIYALTKGGPGTATDVLSYHAYQDMFFYGKSGYGSAQSMVLLVASLAIVGFLSAWLVRRQRKMLM